MKNFSLPIGAAGLWLLLFMLLNPSGTWATERETGKPKITLAPTIQLSKTSLSGFTAQVGTHSPAQSYTLSYENTPSTTINVFAPDGFEFSVEGIMNTNEDVGEYVTGLVIQTNLGGKGSHVIFVRLKDDALPKTYSGEITNSLIGGTPNLKVSLSGTITPLPDPPTSHLSGAPNLGSTTEGEPGKPTLFTLFIENVMNQVPSQMDITAPNDFEMSLVESGPYSSKLELPFATPKVIVRKTFNFFVRLKGGLPVGDYSTIISAFNPQTNTSTATKAKVLPTLATAGVSPSNLTGFQSSQNNPSVEQNYLLVASALPSEVVSQFTVVAPAGFQVSTQKGGPYQDNLVVGSNADDHGTDDFSTLSIPIFVIMKSNLSVGLHSGEILNINSLVGTHKVTVSGEAFANKPVSLTSGAKLLTGLTTAHGSPSATKNYLLVLKNADDFPNTLTKISAPDGFEVTKTKDGDFNDDLFINFDEYDVSPDGTMTIAVFVRIKADAPVGNISGALENNFGSVASLAIPIDGIVTPGPETTVNPTALTFSTLKDTPSAAKSFTISGTHMPKSNPAQVGVTVTAPAGFEASTSETGPFSDQFNTLAIVGDDFTASRTLFVRLKGASVGAINGTLSVQMANATPSTIALNGTVTGPAPVLNINPTSLTGFTSNGITASEAKSYLITSSNFPGGDLSAESAVTIEMPSGFEMSLGGDFSDGLSISLNGNSTIFVRMKAGLSVGNHSGNIKHTNPLVPTINVAVSGTVTGEPVLTSNPEIIENFAAEIGKPGRVKSYQVKAQNFPAQQTLVIDAPNRFEVSKTETGVFEDKIQFTLVDGSLDATVFVRLRDNAPEGINSGNIVQRIGTLAETIVIVSGRVVQVFPVTLASFEGKALPSGKALLEWKTTQETNNAGFEIQKSEDAKSFEMISWIEGKGTFNGLNVYNFTDETLPTTSYYRLRQIDYDGTYSFSRIVVVVPEHESLAKLNAWPNPAPGGIFNVEYPQTTAQTGLFDLTGQPVLNWDKGNKIDISAYPAGLYILKIQTKEGTRSLKLMKP